MQFHANLASNSTQSWTVIVKQSEINVKNKTSQCMGHRKVAGIDPHIVLDNRDT